MFEEITLASFNKYIKVDIVIIVANDNELEIGKKSLLPLSDNDSKYEITKASFTYYCGKLGVYSTCIVRTNNQGNIRSGAARDTVKDIVESFGKNILIISAGIAFGLKKNEQKLGDILVSQIFYEYDISKIKINKTYYKAIPLEINETLFNKFSQENKIEMDGTKYNIFKGEILSSEKLVNNPVFREELIQEFPDAIGGEMEGAGIYRTTKEYGIPSILIKAISDWGDGTKENDFQMQAAKISFEYIQQVLHKKDIFSPFNIEPIMDNFGKLNNINIDAENILPLLIPPVRLTNFLENEVVHEDYKYYSYAHEGYLFLKNNLKSILSTLYNFSRKIEVDSLYILITKENKSHIDEYLIDKIEFIKQANAKHELNLKDIYYINDLIFNLSKRTGMVTTDKSNNNSNIYIDQKIYAITKKDIQENIKINVSSQKGISHFIDKIQKNSSLISIITGEGGIGKTQFLDELQKQINGLGINKKVIFLSSDEIINSFDKSEINSINDLYQIIMDNNGWDYSDQKLLELNFSCGNIILLIDGLEEIHADLGEDFDLNGFFNSISTISKTWQNVKILITSREEYLDKILEISSIDEIQFYKLLGFQKEDLQEYLNIVYDGDQKKKITFHSFLAEMGLSEDNHISPLYVDWIVNILENRSSPQKNKYLVTESQKDFFKKDKLFQLLIQRELDKKNIEVNQENSEQLFSILVDLIVENKGQYISFDEFKEICESYFESKKSKDISEMTLFKQISNKKIKVRHELLNILVPSRYLLRETLDNKLMSENIDYVLSLYSKGDDDRGHMKEMLSCIQEYIHDAEGIKKLLTKLLTILKDKIDTKYYGDDKRIKLARKAISGTMYLALNINSILDKEERSKLLKELFDNKFKYFSIFGSFYPISFKDITIIKGYFYEYENFNDCIFPENRTVFEECNFVSTNIKQNNNIRKSHFNKKCTYHSSNIEEIAIASEELKKMKRKYAEEFLANLAKFIRLGQKSEHLIKRHVSPKPKNLQKTLKLLTDKHNFLKMEKWKTSFVYSIVKSSDADNIKMKNFSGYEKLLEELSKEM